MKLLLRDATAPALRTTRPWRKRARSSPRKGAFERFPGARVAAVGLALAGLVGCRTARWLGAAQQVIPLVREGEWMPQAGDLLFQDLDGSPLADAIEAVTEGCGGAKLTHVGLAAFDPAGKPAVLEAISRGVVETPLSEFLARSRDNENRPKVLVGRIEPRYRHLIPSALAAARRRLGRPYDDVFDFDNDADYCSELVYFAFREAGAPALFQVDPMTFREFPTGPFMLVWIEYFEKLGVPIPEGRPGLNPGSMSRSRHIRIVAAYGRPEGLTLEIGVPATSDGRAKK